MGTNDLIAKHLAEYRTSKGVAQDVVAERLGVSVSAISRLEAGDRRLDIDRVFAWARALGVDAKLTINGVTFGDDE